ncbi:MAG: PASTA domain-containing protein, partial [Bacteroidota bacterium]|nr:PASTA domain-containing protein [Bacteroidota bacterium]
SGATAFKLFKGTTFKIAGKTGTALVAQGSRGYSDHIFQSSFAGFFPADDPQYTCVVVIVNKPHAANHYGASVAGPVFKEIAEKLYTMYVRRDENTLYTGNNRNDSNYYSYEGRGRELRTVLGDIGVTYVDSAKQPNSWIRIAKSGSSPVATGIYLTSKQMPLLTGMGLKDAIYVCENMGLKVSIKGVGKVIAQSLSPGQPVEKGELINLELNQE